MASMLGSGVPCSGGIKGAKTRQFRRWAAPTRHPTRRAATWSVWPMTQRSIACGTAPRTEGYRARSARARTMSHCAGMVLAPVMRMFSASARVERAGGAFIPL